MLIWHQSVFQCPLPLHCSNTIYYHPMSLLWIWLLISPDLAYRKGHLRWLVWRGKVFHFDEKGHSGSSDSKESEGSKGDLGLIPGSGRSPGEGHGYLLQFSCLEKPMNRGALVGLQSMGSQRVGHDWVTKHTWCLGTHLQPGSYYRNVTSTRRPGQLFNGDKSTRWWRGKQVLPSGVWNWVGRVSSCGGRWTALGYGETKRSTLKSPLSRFGAQCPSCLVGKALGSRPAPVSAVSCSRSVLEPLSS